MYFYIFFYKFTNLTIIRVYIENDKITILNKPDEF